MDVSYILLLLFFFIDGTNVADTNALLSYQTSKTVQSRFINIQPLNISTEREREYIFNVCGEYLIELKTHARSENRILSGNRKNIFSSGKHTHICIDRFTGVRTREQKTIET